MGYYDSYCEKNNPIDTYNHCVCNVVKRIVKAQNEVQGDGCSTGCDRAIQQLNGNGLGSTENTTIPFMLYCKKTCGAFVGSGVFRAPGNRRERSYFGCVESPVFRANQFVKNSDCCVHLELLLPVSEGHEMKPCHPDGSGHVCRFFPKNRPVTDFIATGICLTVDLNDFSGITCLDPINPIL